MAKAAAVRVSTNRSVPGSSGESSPGRGSASAGIPVLACPSMVLGPHVSSGEPSVGDSNQERPSVSGRGTVLHVAAVSAYHTPL